MAEKIIEGRRQCGGCTLCCYYLLVREYESARNQYCRHCRPGLGCSIYGRRAEVCRNFQCLWLSQPQIPQGLRPDKSGVMLELPAGCSTYICYVHPDKPNADRAPAVITFLRKIAEAGNPVVVYRAGQAQKIWYLPKGISTDWARADLRQAHLAHIKAGRA